VILDQPPFGLEPRGLLLDIETEHWLVKPGERLRTIIFEHPKPQPWNLAPY
jgi:hypothetical protein